MHEEIIAISSENVGGYAKIEDSIVRKDLLPISFGPGFLILFSELITEVKTVRVIMPFCLTERSVALPGVSGVDLRFGGEIVEAKVFGIAVNKFDVELGTVEFFPHRL